MRLELLRSIFFSWHCHWLPGRWVSRKPTQSCPQMAKHRPSPSSSTPPQYTHRPSRTACFMLPLVLGTLNSSIGESGWWHGPPLGPLIVLLFSTRQIPWLYPNQLQTDSKSLASLLPSVLAFHHPVFIEYHLRPNVLIIAFSSLTSIPLTSPFNHFPLIHSTPATYSLHSSTDVRGTLHLVPASYPQGLFSHFFQVCTWISPYRQGLLWLLRKKINISSTSSTISVLTFSITIITTNVLHIYGFIICLPVPREDEIFKDRDFQFYPLMNSKHLELFLAP